MSAGPRILVATDVASDAEIVSKLLREEFDSIVASSDPDRLVQDFEKHKPSVLVLAFNTLGKAERHYLGLYRQSTVVHTLPHRALILCAKDELRQAYELCKKENFDDYVLFWPLNHDAPRLRMAVHHALKRLADTGGGRATASEFAAQARRVAILEGLLEEKIAQGGEYIKHATHTVAQAEKGIDAALDGFSRQLTGGIRADLVEVKDSVGLQQEINRLKAEELARHFQSVADAVQPLHRWADGFKEDLAPQLESMRALKSLAESVHPVVLIVDDDPFQHLLLQQILQDSDLELIFCSSGADALAMLHKRRPDLILMDVNLPDIDGVEITRRLKAAAQFASLPIVMITGQSEKTVVVESLKAGAMDFVVKPVDRLTLLAKVRKFLG